MRWIARIFTGSVRRRLLFGFGIVLVMILVFAAVAQLALSRVLGQAQDIEPISVQIEGAQAFALAMSSIETNLQQYVLTGSTSYENDIRDNLSTMHSSIGSIRRADETPDNRYVQELEEALTALDRQVQGVFNVDIFAAGAGARNTLLVTIYRRLDVTIESYQALYSSLLQRLKTSSTEQQSIINDLIVQLALLGLVIAAAALVISYVMSRSLAGPVSRTAAVAADLAAGKLDARVDVGDRQDEIGRLGRTFNAMADQLRGLIGSLEDRVSARTRDLSLTLEVGQISTRLYQREDFLARVVEFIHESFDLYYAQVYLLDDARRYAVLRAGTTEVGERLLAAGHRLPLDQTSMVARAVQTQTSILVDDTQASEVHRPNPLLPDTRSEVTVPLIVADQILGVLDLQARQPGTFNVDNLPVFEAMASQLAAALRNVQSFAETRDAIERADLINRRLTEQRWGDFLGQLSQGHSLGYAYDLQSVQALSEPLGEAAADSPSKIARPVSLRGQPIGAIVVADEADRHWDEEDISLIENVAERVALAVEQYRAADETAHLAAEMQTLAELSTEIAGTLDLETLLTSVANLTRDRFGYYHAHLYLLDEAGKNLILSAGAGEIGQLMVQAEHRIAASAELSLVARAQRTREIVVENDIRHAPDFLPNPMLPFTRAEMAVPMLIGERAIGVLDVQAREANRFTDRDKQILSTLASQVAIAVQNAGLFDETAHLAAEMQTVAELSTEIAGTLDLDTLLTSVANLTRDRFGLYHAHLYLLDEAGENLILSAGAGEIGQLMVQSQHSIPASAELSLVSRAQRTREIVVENDIRHSPNFLPNPMLPFTRAEMAVPMLIGERAIGVLDVQAREANRFTDRDKQILSTLASQVAIAVQNAGLFDETAHLAAEMQTVAELSTEIAGTLDLDTLLTSVANLTRDRFGYYHAHLYLLDEAGGNLILSAGAGEIGQLMVQVQHSIPASAERSLVARAQRTREIVVENDVRHAPYFLPNPMLPFTRAEMAVPLLVGERAIGVLDVQAREANRFTDRDKQILSTLASQVAIAAQNARLFTESQQRLAVIENAPFMVLLTTIDGRPIYSNRAAIKVLGAETADDVQSMSLADAVPPEENERITNEIVPTTIQRGVWQGESSLLRRDGSVIPTDTTMIAIYDDEGQPAMLAAIIADISARKLAERERFERETLLNMIINTSPDWIFTKDTAYRFLLVNRAFAQFYGGLEPEEMIGKTDYELGTPVEFIEGDPEKGIVGFRADDRRVVEGGESLHNPNDPVQHRDGSYHVYDTSKLPLRDESGRVIGVLGVSRDMTEQYQAAEVREQLLLQTEQQAYRLTLLNQMATALSEANSVDDLYRVATTHATAIFDAEMGGLTLVTPERDTYELYNPQGESSGMRLPLVGSWVNEVLASRQAVVVDDLAQHPGDIGSQYLVSQGLRSSMSAALIVGEQVLGTLNVSKSEPAGFDQNDVSLMQQVVSLVAARLQNQNLLQQTQARVRDLQTLNRVADRIRTITDPTAMLESIARVVTDAFGADNAVVSRFYHQLHGWRGLVGVGEQMNTAFVSALIEPAGAYPHGVEAAQKQDVVAVEDTATYLDFSEDVQTLAGVKSVLALPVVYEQDFTGVLFLNYTNGYRRFSSDEIDLARGLSDQIAVGFNQHVVEQQVHRRAAEMQTVAEVGTEAASALDMNVLLKNVSDLAKERFGLYHAHIYLLDESGEYMVLAAGAGETGDKMVSAGHRIPVSRTASLVVQSARDRRPLIVNNVTLAPEFLPNPLLPETRSEMAVPMIVGETVVGVLDLQSDRLDHFDAQSTQVQSTLASQIAVAVQNARLYAEQVETADTLREVDRLKTEFLASMSHELRTPLNSIIGYAEVLLDGIDGELNEDMVEDIGAIHGSGKHLLSLINDVLDLAKIEAGQMDLVAEGFDIKPVIEDMANSNRVLVKDKPVHMVVDIPVGLPFVRGDQLRVRQVINNLMSNAAKFTEEGDISITAEVYARDPNMVVVSISDSGIGMTPDQLRLIFDRFRQVDQSHTRRAGGTGLGLAITKELVEMHGGAIWAESVYGSGSTFRFTLPIAERVPVAMHNLSEEA